MLAFCLPLVSRSLTLMPRTVRLTRDKVGGALSDLKWGKFRTIAIGTVVGAISHLLFVYGKLNRSGVLWVLIDQLRYHLCCKQVPRSCLFCLVSCCSPCLPVSHIVSCTEVPRLIREGAIKSAIAPLMAEQYPHFHDYITVLPSGQRVVVDREGEEFPLARPVFDKRLTISNHPKNHVCVLRFHQCWSIHSHRLDFRREGEPESYPCQATTMMETAQYVGFWLAYLIPGVSAVLRLICSHHLD